jgi:hypothetical protein
MAGPATRAADVDWLGLGVGVSAGDGVAADGVAADADGVVEDSAADGEALDADAAVATGVVLASGAAPVVTGPHPARKVSATTAIPATSRAMGLRAIATPS